VRPCLKKKKGKKKREGEERGGKKKYEKKFALGKLFLWLKSTGFYS
jgi:hypothetical protein